jgi:hypothetical protein
MARNYWTCSKFADWLRGTPKLDAGTSEEWSKWRKDAKSAHPFRWWLTEEALDTLDDVWCYIPERINDVRYYLNNRYTSKTHALTSTLKRGQWHEFSERLLHCSFDSFVDFIEIETAWSHVCWGTKEERAKYRMPWWRSQWYTRWFAEWRCAEAAIAHLEWEMTLKYDDNWMKKTDPLYGKPTPQAEAAKEKWALYYWWKHVRPQRADAYDYCGWTQYCEDTRAKDGDDWIFGKESKKDKKRSKAILDAMDRLEQQYDTEDEEMLIRLVKLRKSLWT